MEQRRKENYPVQSPCVSCPLPVRVACNRKVPSEACDLLWKWLADRGDWMMGVKQLTIGG